MFGKFGLVEEAFEFVRTFAPFLLVEIPEHLGTPDALDRADELAAASEDDGERLGFQAAVAARRAALGDPERALADLTAIEPELSPRKIGLVTRMLLRIDAAERLGPTDPRRAEVLLEQSIAVMEDLLRQDTESDRMSLLDDDTQAALLRLADVATQVGDREWALSMGERTLAALLAAQPPAMFWYVEPLLWRTRERASIAAVLARLGAVDRAKELLTQAAADAQAIQSESTQAEALGIVAERLLAVPDAQWVESSVRALLSSAGTLPGAGEAALYVALAREGVVEALAPARAIIERHLASPDYDFVEVVEAVAEFSEKLDAEDALEWAAHAEAAAWATDDSELRDRLLVAALLIRSNTGADAGAALEELDPPRRGIAYAALATLCGERDDQAGAISALERAVEGEVDAAVLLAAVPRNAAAETVDRFLGEARELIGAGGLGVGGHAASRADRRRPGRRGGDRQVHLRRTSTNRKSLLPVFLDYEYVLLCTAISSPFLPCRFSE